MSLLLSLSDDLLIICLDWLGVNDLGCLDATCQRYHHILQAQEIWYEHAQYWVFSSFPCDHPDYPYHIHINRGVLEMTAIPQQQARQQHQKQQQQPQQPLKQQSHHQQQQPSQHDHKQNQHQDTIMASTPRECDINMSYDTDEKQSSCDIIIPTQYQLKSLSWHRIVATVASRSAARGTATLVMDMGSCSSTVGLGGTFVAPRSFPSIQYITGQHIYFGHDIRRYAEPHSQFPITLPLLHANETGEWGPTQEIWNYALNTVPNTTYAHGRLLICDQLLGGPDAMDRMMTRRLEIASKLFAIHQTIPSIAFCNDALLALLSVGRTTGVVFHIGFTHTCVAVIVNGKVQNIENLPYHDVGGQSHSRLLLQQAFIRHTEYEMTVPDMFTFVPLMKRACYVAMDAQAESSRPLSDIAVSVGLDEGRHPHDDVPVPPPVILEHERFQSSEVFFMFPFRLHLLILDALRFVPASQLPMFTSNIVLSGRSTCFRGFLHRIQHELKQVLPQGLPLNIIPCNESCTWLGGSVLSSLSGLDDMCITRQELSTQGIAAVRRKAEF